MTQNGDRPLLSYWCESQEVRTSGESPFNDLLDFGRWADASGPAGVIPLSRPLKRLPNRDFDW
jgi:hypothetical protein